MAIDSKFIFPIPEDKLIKRFEKPFNKLTIGQSATLIALPHTGRTSHIRFITTNVGIQRKLGIKDNMHQLVFIDIDKNITNSDIFSSELLRQLTDKAENELLSHDTYTINNKIFEVVSNTTTNKSIILVVTLNKNALSFLNEIEILLTFCQKAAKNIPLSIFWSIDTDVLTQHTQTHSSSSIYENIFYYPTFDKEETRYSIQRILLSKGVDNNNLKINSYELTGGISGLFHAYVNSNHDTFINSEYRSLILSQLKESILENPTIIDKITTKEAFNLILSHQPKHTTIGLIKFKSTPTAQEINIVNFIQNQKNSFSSRDDIAKALWGKAWERKYSDWAIDKAVERLRKNMAEGSYKLITIKNLGYQLIKFI